MNIFTWLLWAIFGGMVIRNTLIRAHLGTLASLPTVRQRLGRQWLWTCGFGLAACYFTWGQR